MLHPQMRPLPADPFESLSLRDYASRLRSGEVTVVETVAACLDRIDSLNSLLDCYTYVAHDAAMQAARTIDAMRSRGSDLGPLMGVPVAIKDIFAVEGMPVRCGSDLDVSELVGREGPLVAALRRAGCIVLGKTATVEFAFGAAGVNLRQKTPRNPRDSARFRVSGGSSSGSGVAVAAGMCGFALGSDTGGSIRNPAAFCGVFGHKATAGSLSGGGVFQVSSTFDSFGFLTRNADDAGLIWGAVKAVAPIPVTPQGLRIGLPAQALAGAHADVAGSIDAAITALQAAGVQLIDLEVPDFEEADKVMPVITGSELLANIGRERFLANRHVINPDVAARISGCLTIGKKEHEAALRARKAATDRSDRYFEDCDLLLLPSKWNVAPCLPNFEDLVKESEKLAQECAGPTRGVNYLGLSAVSLPLRGSRTGLPVGLQLVGKGGDDSYLLAASQAIADLLEPPALPDMNKFQAEIISSGTTDA